MQHFNSGFFASKPDDRFSSLNDAVRFLESQTPHPSKQVSDPDRTAAGNFYAPEPPAREVAGLVTHAIPALGWYRVQTATSGVLSCTVRRSHASPLGPQPVETVSPGTLVTVRLDPMLAYGVIVGAVPVPCCDDRVSTADCVRPGSGVGYRRERLHTHPLQNFANRGGAADFLPGMPYDLLAGDRGLIAPTGLRVLASDFAAELAVNEMCGLAFSYFDDSARLAARNYLFESGAAEERHASDEGELHAYRGVGLYPWEVLGRYAAPGPGLAERRPDLDVLYAQHVSPIDLAAANRDAQPIYRYEEHASYPANGVSRSMSVPVPAGDIRHRKQAADHPDDLIGVWREHVSPTGAYSLVSAKELLFAKRAVIPIPRRQRAAADPKGDDARADNYRFSNQFGSGPPHLIKDFPAAAQNPGLAALLAADDAVAYHLNWQVLAGFHYHAGDWKVGRDAANPQFPEVQSNLDYFPETVQPPDPFSLHIDSRYGSVRYYATVSFLKFSDDGGVILADGYGSTVRLSGGHVLIDAPKDIRVSCGGTYAVTADQVVLKSNGSMDLSSGKDQRFKSENHTQFLSANSGSGGMLFHSKSAGVAHDFRNKIGEDVVDSGIVFKAAESHVVALAQQVYLRTDNGGITLDAGQGSQQITAVGSQVNLFAATGVGIAFGPHGSSPAVNATYSFAPNRLLCDAAISAGGDLTLFGGSGNLIATGSIEAAGSIGCAGKMADGSGGFLGKTKNLDSQIRTQAGVVAAGLAAVKTQQGTLYSQGVVRQYYLAGQIGNAAAIVAEAFSYRDAAVPGLQYGTADFKWAGSRWEEFLRRGSGGAVAWVEKPVKYAGQDLYPWPGRVAWKEDEDYLAPPDPQFADPATLKAADRGAAYESPLPPVPKPRTMAGSIQVTRPGN